MKLLDLFCGAGGAGKGYQDAGFDITGIDIAPQPDYIQYERGATRTIESYHAKAKERRDLVRRQQDMKLESCRAKGCIK